MVEEVIATWDANITSSTDQTNHFRNRIVFHASGIMTLNAILQ
jgi:hypothetical protein